MGNSPPASSSDVLSFPAQPNEPILDNRTTSSTVQVPSSTGMGSLSTVKVAVDIDHTYVGDLTITLTHGAKQVVLFVGEGAGNGLSTVFTTDAFSGMSPLGPWTLSVSDSANWDQGVLKAWALQIQGN